MELTLYIVAKTIQLCLSLVSLSMVIRMILPVFADPEGNVIYAASCYISEPFVLPVRFVMAKLGIGQSTPIDLAFIVAYLIVILLGTFLPAI